MLQMQCFILTCGCVWTPLLPSGSVFPPFLLPVSNVSPLGWSLSLLSWEVMIPDSPAPVFSGSPGGEGPLGPARDGAAAVGAASQKNMSCFFSAAFRVTAAGLDAAEDQAGFPGRTVLCDVMISAQTKQGT